MGGNVRWVLRPWRTKEVEGRARDLNEYVIGVEVLGRPKAYSPAEDSSVRTRAYELRQKLQKLYAMELRSEPVQIVIAKGAYTPQYVKADADHPVEPTANVTATPPPLEASPFPAAGAKPRRRVLALLAIGMVFGSALTFVFVKTTASARAVDQSYSKPGGLWPAPTTTSYFAPPLP